MIVDCHTHLSTFEQWGEEFTRPFSGAYKGKGIDLHTTPERHWDAMKGVDKVIAFGINSTFLRMHTPNDQIAGYSQAHPEKVVGFMSVDPNDPNAIDELERCVHDLKLKGIKMSPVYQGYDPMDPRAQEIYRRAVKYNLPILVHAAFQSIPRTPMKWANPLLFDEVAMQFPDLKIILAHMGLPWYTDAMVVVRKHRNMYTDITGVSLRPWWGYQALVTFYESDLMHKLLFGSDFPIITVEDTMQALRNINRVVQGTGMPQIPAELIENVIQRDTLKLLDIE
jgi:predicted TIM-barrel fold metal-dependent hydrolase